MTSVRVALVWCPLRVSRSFFSAVDLHVSVHRAFLLVAFSTDVAAVGFLPSVRQHVSLQIDLLDEAFAAELAAKWFLFLVEPLMCLQRNLLAKPLPAETADEGLLAGVDPHVGIQVADLTEILPTDPAGVRFLPSVDPFMHIQVLAHGECFAADVTVIDSGLPSGVALDVSLQDSAFNESLPAEFTNIRPFAGVQLHVSLQRALPGEVFAAVFAMKRFLTGVRPHVDLHVPEADTTDVTHPVGFSVALDVQLQTFRGFRLFSAYAAAAFGSVHVSICVPHKVSFVVERVPADLAAVRRSQTRFSASASGSAHVGGLMDPDVSPQFGTLAEAFPAPLAAKRCLSVVDFDVPLQRAGMAELFVTNDAPERLLCCVDPHVSQHVSLLIEAFSADVAAKWFLSGVQPQVGLLSADRGELLAAYVAGPAAVTMRLKVQPQTITGLQAFATQTTNTLRFF